MLCHCCVLMIYSNILSCRLFSTKPWTKPMVVNLEKYTSARNFNQIGYMATMKLPWNYRPSRAILFSKAFISQIAKFMGPIWGWHGSCRPQMGSLLVPWTLLSGMSHHNWLWQWPYWICSVGAWIIDTVNYLRNYESAAWFTYAVCFTYSISHRICTRLYFWFALRFRWYIAHPCSTVLLHWHWDCPSTCEVTSKDGWNGQKQTPTKHNKSMNHVHISLNILQVYLDAKQGTEAKKYNFNNDWLIIPQQAAFFSQLIYLGMFFVGVCGFICRKSTEPRWFHYSKTKKQ